MNLLRSDDYLRLSRAVDCDTIRDAGFLAWSITIALSKLTDWWQSVDTPDLFRLHPDALLAGLRLISYRPEFEKWRQRHQEEFSIIRELEKFGSLEQMVKFLSESISTLLKIVR